jgi:chemotaxis signal transduction protein
VNNALSHLDNRAAELRLAFDRAFAAPPRPDAPATEDFLAIVVGSTAYAIRCAEISGLIADKKITRTPTSAATLHGMGGFRGTILPVYSLAALLGHALPAPPRWTVIAASMPVALAFEALDGNLRVEREAILSREGDEPGRKYVRDFVPAQGRMRPILHLPSILETIGKREQGASKTERG